MQPSSSQVQRSASDRSWVTKGRCGCWLAVWVELVVCRKNMSTTAVVGETGERGGVRKAHSNSVCSQHRCFKTNVCIYPQSFIYGNVKNSTSSKTSALSLLCYSVPTVPDPKDICGPHIISYTNTTGVGSAAATVAMVQEAEPLDYML